MSARERRRIRPLESYYGPDLLSRVERLLFDSGKPGRESLGERLAARLDELLVVAGLRLFALALFVDLVTGEMFALTAFNAVLSLPVFALTVYQFVGRQHSMLDGSLRSRLGRWRRDRRWYSKRRRPGPRQRYRIRNRVDDSRRL